MSTDKSEREAFEAWADDQGFVLTRVVHGDDYQDLRAQGPWEAWKARALQPSQPATVVPVVIAWVHESDPHHSISAPQKEQALRDGGASASSVRPYSIAAYVHPSAPAESGWQWVPVEPTPAMLHAMWQDREDFRGQSENKTARHHYALLLKAAPSAAQPGGEGGA